MRKVDEGVEMSGYQDVAVILLESGHVSGDYGTDCAAVAVVAPGAPVGEGIDDTVEGIVGSAGTVGAVDVVNTADNVLLAGSDEDSLMFARS